MENLTKKQYLAAIRSMGYRKMGNHNGETVYGKPVATNLFTISMKDGMVVKFVNHFMGADGKHHIMESKKFNPALHYPFVPWIKECEGYTHITPSLASDFHFINQEELAEIELED